jgi:hypothetical protein
LAHALLVEQQLRTIFDYRERAVLELLGASPAHAARSEA